MLALKVVAEGYVTSFRYHDFMWEKQPTYEMPPPATIYGHICSAVGEYISPATTQFAYHFTHEAKFVDYEHLHFFGKEPKMNPFRRELLFQPRLTLYLSNVQLKAFFLSPRYAVTLGRAQDLMTYVDIHEVELQPAKQAFFAHTLLPLKYAAQIGGRAFAVTMPRFLDPERRPTWAQYAVLQDAIEFPNEDALILEAEQSLPIWVDPEADATHPYKPLQRGVIWHEWL